MYKIDRREEGGVQKSFTRTDPLLGQNLSKFTLQWLKKRLNHPSNARHFHDLSSLKMQGFISSILKESNRYP